MLVTEGTAVTVSVLELTSGRLSCGRQLTHDVTAVHVRRGEQTRGRKMDGVGECSLAPHTADKLSGGDGGGGGGGGDTLAAAVAARIIAASRHSVRPHRNA